MDFEIHYESFGFSSDTGGHFIADNFLQTPSDLDFGFYLSVPRLDFKDFPQTLTADIFAHEEMTGWARWGTKYFTFGNDLLKDFKPTIPIEIERGVQIRSVTLGAAGRGAGSGRTQKNTVTFVHTPPGDTNNDGIVAFDDFLILSSKFGQVVVARWEDGDFDGDGDVGFSDFLLMSANFASQPVAVPEPATAMPMVMGWAIVILRWGRSSRLI